MADSVVSFALNNLSQVLANEAKLLCGVEDRIRSLHNELRMINVFLKTSEAKKNKKEIEEEVVSQIKDVAHEAEDVIDTFIANVAEYKRRNILGRMLHAASHTKLRRDVAQKIDSIKTTINEICDNKIKFDLEESGFTAREEDQERAQLLHKRRRIVEEDDVVGFFHDSKVVTKRLVEADDSRLNVVSIIGMGGLGKTSLARKVYNSNEVKEYFSSRAWVYVSNDCRAKELLLALVKCLMPNPEYQLQIKNTEGEKQRGIDRPRDLSSLSEDELKKMVRDYLKKMEGEQRGIDARELSSLSEDELKKKVREYLQRTRYLLVLDDLWKTQDWDEVQDAFPDDNNGSKILITSRLKEVALHTSQDPPHYLQFLSEEESWELFSKKVFRREECPSSLDTLGKQIVKSCRGLPLSIVVLAGLLVNKEKSHREWSKVVGHVNWYLTRDETQVKDIVLKLSYDNLPRRLKPCFLYLGIYPEDFEIHVRRLLQKWVAEGFVQEFGNRNPEDVAEDYLYELIDRSLIQVARVKTSGGVKTCRIHDLLRDLCISESKEDKVFEVCTDNNVQIQTKPRRLSIHCSMDHYVSSSNNDHSCVRSLLYFNRLNDFSSREWTWLLKSFRLVHVLDIGSKRSMNIPSNLGVFIHLRYLRIDSEYVACIPASICTLRNLQTLDMASHLDIAWDLSWPDGMWKLKQLRHLYTPGPVLLPSNRSKSDNEVMGNLQTISFIAFNRQTASQIEEGRFPKLRKLGLQISSDSKHQLPKLLQSLQQLRYLRKLQIWLKTKDSLGPLPSNCASMEWHIGYKAEELSQSLQQLNHLNELKFIPALDLPTCPDAFPPSITKLTLAGITCLNEEGVNALGNLTKLRILKLSARNWSSGYFDLNCTAGSFPQLQVFHIKMLNVHNWKLADGAMPCLQSLVIDECSWLDDLPNELLSLNALRKVQVMRPSRAMALRLGNLEMKDGCQLIITFGRSEINHV